MSSSSEETTRVLGEVFSFFSFSRFSSIFLRVWRVSSSFFRMFIFLSSFGEESLEDDECFLDLGFSFSPFELSSGFEAFSGVEFSSGFSFGILLLMIRLDGDEFLLGILDFLLSSFQSGEESLDLLLSSLLSVESREVEGLGD